MPSIFFKRKHTSELEPSFTQRGESSLQQATFIQTELEPSESGTRYQGHEHPEATASQKARNLRGTTQARD